MIGAFPQLAVDNYAKLWRTGMTKSCLAMSFKSFIQGAQRVKTSAVGRDQNDGLKAINRGLEIAAGFVDDGETLSLSWTPAPLGPLPWLLLVQNLLKGASPAAFQRLPGTDSDRSPVLGCALAGHRNHWTD